MSQPRRRWIWGILLVAALPRLAGIGAPPIGHHGWRQADTAAVARNFLQDGHRLLFPRVDWETPGWVEMELPLYPWAVSLAYAPLGERIWLARAGSVAASLLALYLLFTLADRRLGREPALWAALLWAILPATVFFGRAVMPESWMLAASVAGICLFARWAEGGGRLPLLAAAVLVAVAGLLKPTSLHLGLPLLWLARERLRTSPRARAELAAFAGLVAAPMALWYAHAYRLGAATGATFGIFSGPAAKVGSWDLLLQPDFYHRVFVEFVGGRLLTWLGLAVLLLGLALPRRAVAERLFDWWLAGAAIVLLPAGAGSYQHEYYALPVLAPAVVHMGRALTWIRRRSPPAAWLILVLVALISARRVAGYLAVEDPRRPRDPEIALDLRAAALLAERTAPTDLVIACDGTDPTWFYLSRRRGWGRACETLDKRAVDALHAAGARFLLARHADLAGRPEARRLRRHLLEARRVVDDDGELFLVDLAPAAPSGLPRRTLLRDDFGDGAPPGGWLLREGTWQEAGGRLTLAPVRRRIALVSGPGFAGCSRCALGLAIAVEAEGKRERRGVLTVSGWRTATRSTDAVLDFTGNRLTLARREAGATAAAVSGPLPATAGEPIRLELGFDGFDYQVYLGTLLVLSLPAGADEPAGGGFGLAARNLRLHLDELEVFEPAAPPAPPARKDQ